MSSFSLAWQFLTILPWRKSSQECTPQLLGRSMAYYPAIGLLLGLILWAAHWALSLFLPRALGDGLILLVLVILTGALHLDGLADTLDGLAAGKAPEERLRIMKDHRVGTFGAVGLILVLGLKFLALHSLLTQDVGKALLVALTLSRWSMVQLVYRAPYARREGGSGSPFQREPEEKGNGDCHSHFSGCQFLFFAVLGGDSLVGGGGWHPFVSIFLREKDRGHHGRHPRRSE